MLRYAPNAPAFNMFFHALFFLMFQLQDTGKRLGSGPGRPGVPWPWPFRFQGPNFLGDEGTVQVRTVLLCMISYLTCLNICTCVCLLRLAK